MLYNPRWERGVTELDEIISWLETQRPGRRYRIAFTATCLFGRYVRAMKVGRGYWGLTRLRVIGRESNRLFLGRYWRIAIPHPRTYGAALERAREMRGW